ncbi:hypothetical protein FHX42_002548 [Saccharopolyspora lacisalsi]|uniref:Uncharacterized protein n=1 Tax=Halosaccharopolyspora lacisalsi TaxID=1000566 RepID=A0A839E0C2_9PSEU|nr:hypothetical protein [Halosaccharopolyspora lacisalsi]
MCGESYAQGSEPYALREAYHQLSAHLLLQAGELL